jgi:hypothetical protein
MAGGRDSAGDGWPKKVREVAASLTIPRRDDRAFTASSDSSSYPYLYAATFSNCSIVFSFVPAA